MSPRSFDPSGSVSVVKGAFGERSHLFCRPVAVVIGDVLHAIEYVFADDDTVSRAYNARHRFAGFKRDPLFGR